MTKVPLIIVTFHIDTFARVKLVALIDKSVMFTKVELTIVKLVKFEYSGLYKLLEIVRSFHVQLIIDPFLYNALKRVVLSQLQLNDVTFTNVWFVMLTLIME